MRKLAFLIALVVLAKASPQATAFDPSYSDQGFPYAAFEQLDSTPITVGGSKIIVAFAPGEFRLSRDRILAWIKKSGEAVETYFDGYPVSGAKILIVPEGGTGVTGGQAYGYGGPAIRLTVGKDSTEADLREDWKAVHEMVHLAFPDLPEQHNWMTEGLAVYVESIARVQAGDLTAKKTWSDFTRDMPHGLPEDGDQGLDETHSWGRTYWGGAMFFLLADIEFRKRTGNRVGLQRAVQAIAAAGGTNDQQWTVEKTLATADAATSTHVLRDLYEKMRAAPFDPDLPKMWNDLGIRVADGKLTFDDTAPLAAIRQAITAKPQKKVVN